MAIDICIHVHTYVHVVSTFFKSSASNNTHKATIALLPSTMHPQSWTEPHIREKSCV